MFITAEAVNQLRQFRLKARRSGDNDWVFQGRQTGERWTCLLDSYDPRILALTPGAVATPSEFWKQVREGVQLGLERAQRPIVEAGVKSDLYLEQGGG